MDDVSDADLRQPLFKGDFHYWALTAGLDPASIRLGDFSDGAFGARFPASPHRLRFLGLGSAGCLRTGWFRS
jgi:hypothetical protein